MKISIVIPAHNEERIIKKVIRDLRARKYQNIIVVDDGSSDRTSEIAKKAGAIVVSHFTNRGVGAATATGLEMAKKIGSDIVVTFDGDGQHCPDDVSRVIHPLLSGKYDIVIGSRMKNKKGMPIVRQAANLIGNFFTWLFFGLWVSDSQSGLKAFSKIALEKIHIHTNGYEFCSEVIREIHTHDLRYTEVPIKVMYSEYSLSKGQSFAKGLHTLGKLTLRSIMH